MASGVRDVHVTISLLGPFRVTVGGEVVTAFHADTARALLAYLAMHADANQRRDALAGLLWPEQTNAKALRNLRMALSRVRTALGDREATPPYLTTTRQTIALKQDSRITLDVATMRQALAAVEAHNHPSLTTCATCAARHRQIAGLYRGEFLEGFALDSVSFEAWLVVEREHLHWSALEALQALAAYHENAGDFDAALDAARRQVDLEPWREVAHRQWMRALALSGHRNTALAQFETCRTILAEELGVEPEPATVALYQQIRDGALAPPAPEISPPVSDLTTVETPPPALPTETSPLTLPCLGRERELQTLTAHLERAAAGEGGMVLISGEAGVGKTRLVQTFLQTVLKTEAETEAETETDQAGGRAVRGLVGRGYALESRAAYTLWEDALQDLVHPAWQRLLADLDEVWRRQLARLAPNLGSPPEDITGATPAESRLRLLHGVVQVLHHLTQSGVLCLWFDDLHWADEASLTLLHYIVRHTNRQPLLIIGTYRTNALSHNEHLDQLRRATPSASSIELNPLDRATVAQILAHVGMTKPALLDRIYQHSEGNPLFVVETLNTLVESKQLTLTSAPKPYPDVTTADTRVSGSDTTADETTAWPVPRRILDLIQTRINTLTEPAHRVLAASAVIGRAHGLRLLCRVSDMPALEVTTAVEAAQRRGFLEEHPDEPPRTALSFRHSYFQRAIYESLSVIQRQALHRRAARALVELHRVRPQILSEEVAYHFEQAGDPQAITYLKEAAEQATARYRYRHAMALTTRALAALDRFQPGDAATRFDLLIAREALLSRLGRRADQADDVAAIRRLAEHLQDTARIAQANVREANWRSITGDHEGARTAGERALALYRADGDQEGEAQALRELGFTSWTSGDYGSALTYVRDALALHRRLGNVEGEATALHNLAEIHRTLGSPQQALSQYQNALNLYWARQDQRRQGLTRYGMAHALRQLGDLASAAIHYHRALEHFEAAGDRLMMSRAHHALAGLHRQEEKIPAAQEHLQQALAITRSIGYGLGIAYGLVALSDLQAQQGELAAARTHLHEAITWLQLIEDVPGLEDARTRLQALERDEVPKVKNLKLPGGWVKSHITLAEGKVYCAFESPMAQEILADLKVIEVTSTEPPPLS
jgi:DNA-binding SARP family transcriptional activator